MVYRMMSLPSRVRVSWTRWRTAHAATGLVDIDIEAGTQGAQLQHRKLCSARHRCQGPSARSILGVHMGAWHARRSVQGCFAHASTQLERWVSLLCNGAVDQNKMGGICRQRVAQYVSSGP